jgi:hypothetical protein
MNVSPVTGMLARSGLHKIPIGYQPAFRTPSRAALRPFFVVDVAIIIAQFFDASSRAMVAEWFIYKSHTEGSFIFLQALETKTGESILASRRHRRPNSLQSDPRAPSTVLDTISAPHRSSGRRLLSSFFSVDRRRAF